MNNLNLSFLFFISLIFCASCGKDDINQDDVSNSNTFQYVLVDGELYIKKFPSTYEVTIPEFAEFNGSVYPVTYICEGAATKENKKLNFSSSIKSIQKNAFSYCDIEEIYISDLQYWNSISFESETSNPVSNETKVYVNGELLKSLKFDDSFPPLHKYAFKGFKVDEIIFSEDIETIPEGAFMASEVPVLHLENVLFINDYAFKNSKIKEIYTGGFLQGIGSEAFYEMKGLEFFYQMNVPAFGEDVISSDYEKLILKIDYPLNFSEESFRHSNIYCVDADNLSTLVLGSLNNYEEFYPHYISLNNRILSDILISEPLPTFPYSSLSIQNLRIEKLSFAEGITNVDYIYNNPDLKFLSLPSTLKKINAIACIGNYNPNNLKDIELKSEVPPQNDFDNDFFMVLHLDFYEECTIHVPKGCLDAYRSAKGWRNFKNIIEE